MCTLMRIIIKYSTPIPVRRTQYNEKFADTYQHYFSPNIIFHRKFEIEFCRILPRQEKFAKSSGKSNIVRSNIILISKEKFETI